MAFNLFKAGQALFFNGGGGDMETHCIKLFIKTKVKCCN